MIMTLKTIAKLLLIGLVQSELTLSKVPVQNYSSLLVTVNNTVPNTYGAVCGDDVTNTTSDVICREWGYKTGQVMLLTSEDTVVTNLEMVLWNVSCAEGVQDWSGCQYSLSHTTECRSGPLLLLCSHHRNHRHGSHNRCPAGSEKHAAKCVKCKRGFYSTGHGQNCTRCADHEHSEAGAGYCSRCRLGEAYIHNTCSACPSPGFYGDGETCLSCSGEDSTEYTQRLCQGRGLESWGRVLVGCALGFIIALLLLVIIKIVNKGVGRFRGKQQKMYKHLSEDQPGPSSSNNVVSTEYV